MNDAPNPADLPRPMALSPTARRILELLAERGPTEQSDIWDQFDGDDLLVVARWMRELFRDGHIEYRVVPISTSMIGNQWSITDAGRERLKQESTR